MGERLDIPDAGNDRPGTGNSRLHNVLDIAPVGIYLADAEGPWTYANARACELVGQSRGQVLGRGWTRWLHADDAARVEQSWRHAIDTGTDFHAEYRFAHPCGTVVRVLGRAVVKNGPPDTVPAYVGVLTNVTVTRESESRLEETLRHLEAIYRASPDMIFLHGPDGRLTDVNDKVLECYGYTREEMLTLPFAAFSGGCCSVERAFDLLERARVGEELDFEWCARRKSGEEFPVEVRLRRLSDGTGGGRAGSGGGCSGHHRRQAGCTGAAGKRGEVPCDHGGFGRRHLCHPGHDTALRQSGHGPIVRLRIRRIDDGFAARGTACAGLACHGRFPDRRYR